ncbi:hypothetical protein LSCM1_05635 [Leishmania martiniquensis]|uniref:Adenylate kinase n=1 Tax=Leishmania martiniquensis TaxID=1580590 RepID=A0A836KT92_9TRYP|nr:hypothetical protein LSCM1_05635 [Leishmania martiniquensis]
MSTGSLSAAALQYFESKGIQFILDEAMHNLVLEMPEDPLAFLENAFRRPTPVRVILTGSCGSGKTTLATKIAAHYGIAHVAAPAAAAQDADVPTGVLMKLGCLQKEGKGWVLDGFPQTRADVIQLQTSGISPQLVFELQVPLEVAVARVTAAATDAPNHLQDATAIAKSNALYNVRRIEIINCYKPCYRGIDATRPADEVAADVVKAIDALHLL